MKKHSLSIILPYCLYANAPDISFHYQLYMDLAANRGPFTPGSEGVKIKQKNGKDYVFSFPIPDFSSQKFMAYSNMQKTQGNAITNIGRNWLLGATHVGGYSLLDGTQFGPSSYGYSLVKKGNVPIGFEIGFYAGDLALYKSDKFIVEAPALPPYPLALIDENHQNILPSIQDFANSHRFAFMRVGCGESKYYNGSIHALSADCLAPTAGVLKYMGFDAAEHVLRLGNKIPFSNKSTKGDSGGALFVFDRDRGAWYIAGSVRSSGEEETQFSILNQAKIQSTQKQYHHLLTQNQNITQANLISWVGQDRFKDLIISGGGEITLASNLYLNAGGLIFDSNAYVIKPTSGSKTLKGAGIDIAEGGEVQWYLQGAGTLENGKEKTDFIHKIGLGTLVIKKGDQSHSGIRIGEGEVRLENPNAQEAFGSIALVSGRGKLSITQAHQINGEKLWFGHRGGTLELNGVSVEFKQIYASDQGAKIINSSPIHATLTLQGAKKAYAYHGEILGNLTLNLSNDVYNHFIFDGNILLSGDLIQEGGSLSFQGHPMLHAYTSPEHAQIISNILGDCVFTSPTTFTQQDWQTRYFVFKRLKLTDTKAFIGRNSVFLGEVHLKHSEFKIGGDYDVFIDAKDGQNVVAKNSHTLKESFTFTQILSQGRSILDESILFLGDLHASEKSLIEISNTSSNPYILGDFTLGEKMKNFSLSLDHSKLFVKYAIIGKDYSISNDIHSLLSVQNLLIDLPKASKISTNLSIDLHPSFQTPRSKNAILAIRNISQQGFLTLEGKLLLSANSHLILDLLPDRFFGNSILYQSYIPIIQAQEIQDLRQDPQQQTHITPLKNITYQVRTTQKSIDLAFVRKDASGHDFYTYLQHFGAQQEMLMQKAQALLKDLHLQEDILNALLDQSLSSSSIDLDLALNALCNGDDTLLKRLMLSYSWFEEKAKLDYSSHLIQTISNFSNQITYRINALTFARKIPSPQNTSEHQISFAPNLNNHFWALSGGSYFNLTHPSWMANLGVGYDHVLMNWEDCFGVVGAMMQYTYAASSQSFFNEQSHGVYGGAYGFLKAKEQELFILIMGGSLFSNQSNDFSLKNDLLYAEFNYEYEFKLSQNHSIKPIIGSGIVTMFYDQIPLKEQTLPKKTQISPKIEIGAQYQFCFDDFFHTLNFKMDYFFNPSFIRKFQEKNHRSLDIEVGFDALWVSLGNFGSYSFDDAFKLNYGLALQMSDQMDFGISMDLGLSYHF